MIGLEAAALFCCPEAAADLGGGLCCLTTGAIVAVALGLAGGFLFAGFALVGDSSDPEEYTTGLVLGGTLSFLFSEEGVEAVSALDLPWRLGGNGAFFFVLSVSDAF